MCGGDGQNSKAKSQLTCTCHGSLVPNQSSEPPETTGPAARESQSWRALPRGPGAAIPTAAATSPPHAQGPVLCKPLQYWGLQKSHFSAVPDSDTPAPPPGHEGAERKAYRDPTWSGELGGVTRNTALHLLGGRSPPSWPVCVPQLQEPWLGWKVASARTILTRIPLLLWVTRTEASTPPPGLVVDSRGLWHPAPKLKTDCFLSSDLPSEASRRSGLERRAERCSSSIPRIFLRAGSRL